MVGRSLAKTNLLLLIQRSARSVSVRHHVCSFEPRVTAVPIALTNIFLLPREPNIDFAEMVWSFSSILHGVCQLLVISNNSATSIAPPSSRATPGQQPQRVNALRQSRLFWDQTPNDLVSYHLFKRDACTQAFGAGWSGTTCLPGSTYCCESDTPLCSPHLLK